MKTKVAAALLLLSALPVFCLTIATRPALHWAAERGLTNLAALLIEGGADVNAGDSFGNTPLHLAVRYPDMVQLLLSQGAKVNAKNAFGNTPLHLAVGDKKVVEILLAGGADAQVRNLFEKTPLDYCLRGGSSAYNQSIIETLIKAGAR